MLRHFWQAQEPATFRYCTQQPGLADEARMDLEVEKAGNSMGDVWWALTSGGHFFEKPYDIRGNSGARDDGIFMYFPIKIRERNSEVPESTESLGSWCFLQNPHSLKIGEINGAAKLCDALFSVWRDIQVYWWQKTLGSYIYSYHVSIHCQFVHQHLSYGEAGWVGHCLHEPCFDLAWLVSKQPWIIPTKSWFCFKKAQLAFGTIFIPAWSNSNCAYIPRNLRCFPEIDI